MERLFVLRTLCDYRCLAWVVVIQQFQGRMVTNFSWRFSYKYGLAIPIWLTQKRLEFLKAIIQKGYKILAIGYFSAPAAFDMLAIGPVLGCITFTKKGNLHKP
jgi:hypothetical protein